MATISDEFESESEGEGVQHMFFCFKKKKKLFSLFIYLHFFKALIFLNTTIIFPLSANKVFFFFFFCRRLFEEDPVYK